MGLEQLLSYLPLLIALIAVMFFLSRRKQRRSKRERADFKWLNEKREQVKSWQEGETIAFEEYTARLERQRALIERYNREHGRD